MKILGGTAAISPGVEQLLADAGIAVERVAGASRVDTAVAIAEARVVHERPCDPGRGADR